MRNRLLLVTVAVHMLVAAIFVLSQVQAGGQRLMLGLALAAPWVVSAVALVWLPRLGGWLAAAVASMTLAPTVWYISQVNVGKGAEIAQLLFASPDGVWHGHKVFLIAIAFALLCGIALVLGLVVLARSHPRRGPPPAS